MCPYFARWKFKYVGTYELISYWLVVRSSIFIRWDSRKIIIAIVGKLKINAVIKKTQTYKILTIKKIEIMSSCYDLKLSKKHILKTLIKRFEKISDNL